MSRSIPTLHDGAVLTPHDLWTAWSWEPGVVAGLGISAALDSELMHTLQHTSFLLTALVFWSSVLPGSSPRGRHGIAILSLLSTMVYSGGLGALLTLARTQWYPAYGEAAPLWGLTPLEDQQLAGWE